MSRKRKNEELSEVEKLTRDNKSLRTINKSLMRKIKELDKQYVPEFTEEINKELEATMQKDVCSECGKGFITEVVLGPRKFKKCSVCAFRGKTERV